MTRGAPEPTQTPPAPDRREVALSFEGVLRVVCALAPAALAAAGAQSSPPASHDLAVVRAVGLGWTGALRALDVLVAAPAMLLPVGTRALRAGLASALVAGVAGVLLFEIARSLARDVLARTFPGGPAEASPRLVGAVAAALALTATLGAAWQMEASAPGGAVTGAALVLAALVLAARTPKASPAPLALVLGLCLSYEPLVFVAAAAAAIPHAARGRRDRAALTHAAASFAMGLAPLALGAAMALRPPEIGLPSRALASALGEGAAPGATLPAFATAEIGVLVLAAALAGAALAVRHPEVRPTLLSILLAIGAGALAFALGAPADGSRVAAPVLAAVALVHALAAVAFAAAVLAIARMRVPFAQASAALVVVLELVLPVRAADETFTRREARAPRAAATWNDVAWGPAPPAAVVLASSPATMRRIAAARATGEMRGDLLVVPTYAPSGRLARRALVAEPKLAPLFRDVALGSPVEELSLAQLAVERPLLATFDPRWDRSLARHLVPVGLVARFEPEPRGPSDRRQALEAFGPAKERLVRVAVARADRELAAVTAGLLRARALGIAATGEREVLSRALDDLRHFAPEDAVAAALVRRIVTSRGPIEVRDLAP